MVKTRTSTKEKTKQSVVAMKKLMQKKTVKKSATTSSATKTSQPKKKAEKQDSAQKKPTMAATPKTSDQKKTEATQPRTRSSSKIIQTAEGSAPEPKKTVTKEESKKPAPAAKLGDRSNEAATLQSGPKRGRVEPTQLASTFQRGSKRARVAKSTRAGLHFPVGRIRRHLKAACFRNRVSECAPVYLAAVLEYVVSELGISAAEVSTVKLGKRITPRHVKLAFEEDADFARLTRDVTIAQGGVIPYIHRALQPKKKNGAASRAVTNTGSGLASTSHSGKSVSTATRARGRHIASKEAAHDWKLSKAFVDLRDNIVIDSEDTDLSETELDHHTDSELDSDSDTSTVLIEGKSGTVPDLVDVDSETDLDTTAEFSGAQDDDQFTSETDNDGVDAETVKSEAEPENVLDDQRELQ